jgi:DNA-binding MarR family transcriptional regulator
VARVAADAETIDRLRRVLTRISRRVDRQVSGGGLTSTQLSVLASVELRGPLGLSELADYEGVNPTMLSRVVGKLEELGLIQRQVDETDRRAVRVEVTKAGSDLRRQLLIERSALLADRLAILSKNDAATVLAAIPALEALATELAPRASDAK